MINFSKILQYASSIKKSSVSIYASAMVVSLNCNKNEPIDYATRDQKCTLINGPRSLGKRSLPLIVALQKTHAPLY